MALGISAASFCSDTSDDEKKMILDSLKEENPQLRLFFTTPENVVKNKDLSTALSKLDSNKRICLIAVDEAHCVRQWREDFRPDYLALHKLRQLCSNAPMSALTASVAVDVCKLLNIGEDALKIWVPVRRPNLFIEIRKKVCGTATIAEMASLILAEEKAALGDKRSGIVYYRTKEKCNEVAKQFCKWGILGRRYHSDCSTAEKTEFVKQEGAGPPELEKECGSEESRVTGGRGGGDNKDGDASRPATGGAGSSSSGAPPPAAFSLPSSIVSSGNVHEHRGSGASGRERDLGRGGSGVSGGRGNLGDGDASRPATGGAGSSSLGGPPQAAPSLASSLLPASRASQAERLPRSGPQGTQGGIRRGGSGVSGGRGRGNLGDSDASRPATGSAGSSSSGGPPQAAPSLPSSIASSGGADAHARKRPRQECADEDREYQDLKAVYRAIGGRLEGILEEADSSSDSSSEEIECNLDF
uniref:DNA 3'-5' helicase n=1 Tax=Chromera velia CCMP2878 TaxID=1169474 RepID=A0A0G4HGR1_9ALVE|eukprot:Cvel_27419.t1-p1 / transcript=Cvel_27419.t1 / gene=Cvel_27419 / organism=Chromera_velia_CCMP2878 / gene_product=Mediator of RNA polymerase II transcription subunit, putative / transcript_product=Mediator of RNA polymerase II transcription subunit, putative / location=Cvel_scaffold3417:10601-15551(-) / protein_length=471 / sequence_SO=supercontig / SO=protein_coding / is_pseudo=false